MKRVIGGLVAVMATAALWGCDAVRNILQAALPQAAPANATATPPALPEPEITPISSGVAYSPEPWQPPTTTPTGTVIIRPDGGSPAPWANASPTPSPEPTPTSPPLWGAYQNYEWGNLTPTGIRQLQAWRENGAKLYLADSESLNYVSGMARDEGTGEVAYELTRLDPDEYGFVGGDFYPLKKNVAIDGRAAWGYPDWGFAGTFVERDGKFVFHKPGVRVQHGDYVMNIIAGYIGLPTHLNGDKTKLWDFTQVKSTRKLIPPPGVFDGVSIELSSDIPLTMTSDSIQATYPIDMNVSDVDGRREYSQRIAYDEQLGILLIGGWSEDMAPICWWGAVKQTQAGKKLYVGTKQRLWYIKQKVASLGPPRIVSWLLQDGMVYALRAAGRWSCDKIAYGRAERDLTVDCWLDTFKFPLDLIIDAPAEPSKKP